MTVTLPDEMRFLQLRGAARGCGRPLGQNPQAPFKVMEFLVITAVEVADTQSRCQTVQPSLHPNQQWAATWAGWL